MASSYKVSIYPQGVALIDFAGVLNPAVMGRALQECYQRKCYRIVVELGNTDHAPSKSLEVFSEAAVTLRHLNGLLVFVQVEGPIQIILDMMGLPEKFKFYASRDEALQSVIESADQVKRVQL